MESFTEEAIIGVIVGVVDIAVLMVGGSLHSWSLIGLAGMLALLLWVIVFDLARRV